jgi:hypothetical protein
MMERKYEGRSVIGWMAVGLLVWIVGALLALARPAEGVTLTSFNKSVHRGVFVLGVDDFVKRAFLDSAEAAGVPVTWFCASYYNLAHPAPDALNEATASARRALMREAYQKGHEIAAHSGPIGIDTLTTAEIQSMFSVERDMVNGVVGAYPVSWTYHGNDWEAATQAQVRSYFPGLIRLRTASHDTVSTVIQTAYQTSAAITTLPDRPREQSVDIGVDWSYVDGPHPLPQCRMDRIVYTSVTNLCDSCGTGTASTDTTDMWDFFRDLKKIHGVAVTSLHAPDVDISNAQFGKLCRMAAADPAIWTCTAQQFYNQFGDALDESGYGTIYVSATADTMGAGSSTDPAHLRWIYQCWGQTVQLQSGTYNLNTLTPGLDLQIESNLTFRGPATIACDGSGATVTDDENIIVDIQPTGGVKTGYKVKFANLTFDYWGANNTSSAERIMSISDSNVEIDSCAFQGAVSSQIRSQTNSITGIRVTRSTFTLDTTVTQYGIFRSGSSNQWSIIGNTFTYASGAGSTGTKYGVYGETSAWSTTDSLLNNRFLNAKDATTYYALARFNVVDNTTRPFYRFACAGNEFQSATLANISCRLKSNYYDFTSAILDSIGYYTSSTLAWTAPTPKNWISVRNTTAGDTVKFGGVPLTYMGTQTYWGSIGPTQYDESLYIWPGAVSGRGTLRLNGPWKLLQLVDASVLPVSDSLTAATWYLLPRVYNESDATLVRSWFDAYENWPDATRKKIRFAMDGHTMSISGTASYNGPWALLAAIPGTETASDSLTASTWFTVPRPYNLTDALQLDFWLRCYRKWPNSERMKIRFKVAGADLSFDGAAGHYGPWSAWEAIGTTETASDSLNPSTWFLMPRVPEENYAQLVQNRIYLDAIALWPDSKRKQVRATTR